jgi:carbamoyltransferase
MVRGTIARETARMRAIGLNVTGYISAAALVEDGRLLFAAAQERLTRRKRDRAFPGRVIQAGLAHTGWTAESVDVVAVGWNPAHHLGQELGLLSEANRARAKHLAYVPNQVALALGGQPGSESTQQIMGQRVLYLDHHLAHAASAAFTSPWARGAVVTIDAFGEDDSLTVGRFEAGRIEVLERVRFPHSLGSFYSYVTELLGFQGDAEEYKVMALGAYAEPALAQAMRARLARAYEIQVCDGRLRFELDLNCFDHYLFHRPHDFGPLAELLEITPRRRGDELLPEHFAVAWALQRCFEEIQGEILSYARQRTGEAHAALAGGCFMNSLANGRLERPGAGFEAVHIPAWPDDSGVAVGAALHATFGEAPRAHAHLRHSFYGPSVRGDEAATLLSERKLSHRRLDDVAAEVAARVADGQLVGLARGPMEFGQRALGNRSIFGDPRDPELRDKVNRLVKRREWFRPYAASILAPRVHEVFDAPPGYRADVMEKVRPMRPEWRERAPGMPHADGSVRLHTVDAQTQPFLEQVLQAFEAHSGLPFMLNTSFNVAGMPIACDAADALACFFASGLDAVVLDDVLVTKAGGGA